MVHGSDPHVRLEDVLDPALGQDAVLSRCDFKACEIETGRQKGLSLEGIEQCSLKLSNPARIITKEQERASSSKITQLVRIRTLLA